jgi:pimeloyl-ACP methyl ester carboxylesterase
MRLSTIRSFFATASLLLVMPSAACLAQAAPIRNIVLVHGAFVTGAGWKPVYDILVKDGYHVSVAQHPLTSVSQDVAAVKRILAMQDGPTILVGHSYGGAIITEAGNDSRVAGLVYIAAHALDEGETEAANGKRFPNATKAIKKTDDGFTYLDPAFYPADFAADLPRKQAEFEAHAQALTAAEVFTTPATQPAWKTKPSWYAVAKSDRIINPDLERMYAKRAQSHTIEVEGASHSVYESHPKEVAALIEDAANHALDGLATTSLPKSASQ